MHKNISFEQNPKKDLNRIGLKQDRIEKNWIVSRPIPKIIISFETDTRSTWDQFQ